MINSDGVVGEIDDDVKLSMDVHPGCDEDGKLEGQG
jgi:hypothetical protein